MNANNLFNTVINEKQFNFQPLEFGVETGYHVDVKDDEGTRWEFRMFYTEEKNYSVTGENLPAWITDLEPVLCRAINEHE